MLLLLIYGKCVTVFIVVAIVKCKRVLLIIQLTNFLASFFFKSSRISSRENTPPGGVCGEAIHLLNTAGGFG